ncbi:MAG: lamin tail domain-containing protein, partial [Candidatus Marinimicrobia bacterium]|nr:lamin tail domain-containing protein [Candidatus Neomarinimicrobiota bacterium]
MNVRYTLLYILATVIMHQSHSFGNDLIINEIMPNNVNTLSDEDGNFPDWIELKNLSNTTINLSNYFITDNPLDTFKWKLPNKT